VIFALSETQALELTRNTSLRTRTKKRQPEARALEPARKISQPDAKALEPAQKTANQKHKP
jgi:hypothetical protein